MERLVNVQLQAAGLAVAPASSSRATDVADPEYEFAQRQLKKIKAAALFDSAPRPDKLSRLATSLDDVLAVFRSVVSENEALKAANAQLVDTASEAYKLTGEELPASVDELEQIAGFDEFGGFTAPELDDELDVDDDDLFDLDDEDDEYYGYEYGEVVGDAHYLQHQQQQRATVRQPRSAPPKAAAKTRAPARKPAPAGESSQADVVEEELDEQGEKEAKYQVLGVSGSKVVVVKQEKAAPAEAKVAKGPRPHRCDECSKRFKLSGQLVQHRLRAHGIPLPDDYLTCGECGRHFDRRGGLLSHVYNEHRLSLECPHCKRLFASGRAVSRHVQVIHEKQRGKHTCQFCEKTFYDKTNLSRHLNTHTGERPYLCEVCGSGFASLSNCRSHEKNCIAKQIGTWEAQRRATRSTTKAEAEANK